MLSEDSLQGSPCEFVASYHHRVRKTYGYNISTELSTGLVDTKVLEFGDSAGADAANRGAGSWGGGSRRASGGGRRSSGGCGTATRHTLVVPYKHVEPSKLRIIQDAELVHSLITEQVFPEVQVVSPV